MQNFTPEDHERLHAELTPGETVLWSGKPNLKIIFHPQDWYQIPFGLLIGAFTLVWSGILVSLLIPSSRQHPIQLLVLPIALAVASFGQFALWGRFVYARWKKKRVIYAITSLRAIVLVSLPRTKILSVYLSTLSILDKQVRRDGIGTLKFGSISTFGFGRNPFAAWDTLYLSSGIPVFIDIDDAQTVYALVTDLRGRANRTS